MVKQGLIGLSLLVGILGVAAPASGEDEVHFRLIARTVTTSARSVRVSINRSGSVRITDTGVVTNRRNGVATEDELTRIRHALGVANLRLLPSTVEPHTGATAHVFTLLDGSGLKTVSAKSNMPSSTATRIRSLNAALDAVQERVLDTDPNAPPDPTQFNSLMRFLRDGTGTAKISLYANGNVSVREHGDTTEGRATDSELSAVHSALGVAKLRDLTSVRSAGESKRFSYILRDNLGLKSLAGPADTFAQRARLVQLDAALTVIRNRLLGDGPVGGAFTQLGRKTTNGFTPNPISVETRVSESGRVEVIRTVLIGGVASTYTGQTTEAEQKALQAGLRAADLRALPDRILETVSDSGTFQFVLQDSRGEKRVTGPQALAQDVKAQLAALNAAFDAIETRIVDSASEFKSITRQITSGYWHTGSRITISVAADGGVQVTNETESKTVNSTGTATAAELDAVRQGLAKAKLREMVAEFPEVADAGTFVYTLVDNAGTKVARGPTALLPDGIADQLAPLNSALNGIRTRVEEEAHPTPPQAGGRARVLEDTRLNSRVTISAGDEVQVVLVLGSSNFMKVKTESGEEGWVPADHLKALPPIAVPSGPPASGILGGLQPN